MKIWPLLAKEMLKAFGAIYDCNGQQLLVIFLFSSLLLGATQIPKGYEAKDPYLIISES